MTIMQLKSDEVDYIWVDFEIIHKDKVNIDFGIVEADKEGDVDEKSDIMNSKVEKINYELSNWFN